MRLVTYRSPEGLRPGVLVDGNVVDIRRLLDSRDSTVGYHTVRELLAAGPEALAALQARIDGGIKDAVVGPLGEVDLTAPVPDAGKIICIGLNYRAHAAESHREVPDYPTLFAKWSNSLTGPKDPIPTPPLENLQLDYEGELAVIIGKRASRVSVEDALDHVAGVSVMNDLTSRRLQYETTQWTLGKAIDSFGPMGPALVTLDEIDDIQSLQLRTWVNGQEVQSANTSTMIWTVAQLISIITETITLEPGDIIASGTPAGIGFRREPQLLLGDGDTVEVEIDQIGRIVNTVSVS